MSDAEPPKPESSENEDPTAIDEPAALVPDEPTAAHEIPAVPGMGEPSVAQEVAPESPAAPTPPVAPPAPEPPAAIADALAQQPGGPPQPVSPPRGDVPQVPPPAPADELPGPPPVTSSGLPNPHGLPEIAIERPEFAVGAAFAGGVVLATILKRLVR